MSSTHPIFLLPEMALTAKLVTVVKIDLASALGDQKIPVFHIVTGITGFTVLHSTMIQLNVPMYDLSTVRLLDLVIPVAIAAGKPFYFVLSGLCKTDNPFIG